MVTVVVVVLVVVVLVLVAGALQIRGAFFPVTFEMVQQQTFYKNDL